MTLERALTEPSISVRVVSAIREIAPAAWDACACPVSAAGAQPDNPFLSHAFLDALEASGSATAETGWAPAHLVAEDEAGEVVGVAPAYVKSHSYGEYVFDHAFADAYARAGGRYYPKIQVAVPFTPVTGPRLVAKAGPRAQAVRLALARALVGLMRGVRASSVHLTFLTDAEQDMLRDSGLGFLPRHDIQYHFIDEGYGDFEGFLAALSSRKRKAMRRERREALSNGITIRWLTGSDIEERHWDAFWRFYQDTGSRKWGRPYLTRAFFSELGARMADRVLLVFAERGGRPIAGALNLIGNDTLYGRYWGCTEEHPFLHFEVCYYQAVDFALQRGLTRVEAGAQGDHKLARGYRPVLTHSAHLFAHSGLSDAVDDYLARERPQVIAMRAALEGETPFRKDGEGC